MPGPTGSNCPRTDRTGPRPTPPPPEPHYAGRWRVASKGSFISAQAVWAQRRLDGADTAALHPGTTYLAEILYPQNRIVVDYGDRRDLVLLAAFGLDGTEVPLAEA
ncbi:hypothetical protein ABZZ01_34320, partial [Streptomyces virginiae]